MGYGEEIDSREGVAETMQNRYMRVAVVICHLLALL
jgi:hypothetical protein